MGYFIYSINNEKNNANNINDEITNFKPILNNSQEQIEATEETTNKNNSQEVSKENNINNEIIGNWQPSSAKEDNKEISLRNIYGSSISNGGYLTFNEDGTYSNFVGAYSSEIENDLTGNYTISNNVITLNSKSGQTTKLKYEKINDEIHLVEEKSDSIIVYFSKVQ